MADKDRRRAVFEMAHGMILLEAGPDEEPALFENPVEVITADTPADIGPAMHKLEQARRDGAWIAGWMGYEAGLAHEPRLAQHVRMSPAEPLLAFGLYDGPADPAPVLSRALSEAPKARLGALAPLIRRADYDAAFERVAAYIRQGDCYQVNLTVPFESHLVAGTPLGLYGALRAVQPVAHGGLSDLGGGPVIISRSPELFFRLDGCGRIEARPMKGTAPRDIDPVIDANLAAALHANEKNRAENLMIVDLLRNDISRLSVPGSVRVPDLFHVEALNTVHQMVSTITAQLAGTTSFDRLMNALFPCGSITGAPKMRAIEIIAELEPYPRGAYCGTMGWMAPDGRASFNVLIRTLRVFDDGYVLLNAGGGVVYDSTADGEWEETLWKTRFATLIHNSD